MHITVALLPTNHETDSKSSWLYAKSLFATGCHKKFRSTFHSVTFTLFEIFIFCPKNQLWFPEKIVNLFGWKTREIVVVLDFLAVDNFDFTRKIVKTKLGEKLVKMLGFCQNWIFGQKIDLKNVRNMFEHPLQTRKPIISFKNVRHPWANLKIFNPSKHFQKEFYAFAIILNALYGALKKSQWQKGVEYITILFSESHFIFRDISIFLWGAAHYSKSQIFVQKFNFDKNQHFHEFFAQTFFDNFSREIKAVNR